MIVEERMVDFIHSLETKNSDILEQIEKEALETALQVTAKRLVPTIC